VAEIAEAVWAWLRDPERDQDSIWLRVRTGLPMESALRRVREAMTAEGRAAEPDGINFGPGVVPTPDGPTVLVDDLDLGQRLPVMAAELDRAGVTDGRIELYVAPAHHVLSAPEPLAFLECRLAVRADRVPPWPWNVYGAWLPDLGTRDRIDTAVADWCLAAPGPHTAIYLHADGVTTDVPAGRLREVLAATERAGFAPPDSDIQEVRVVVEGGGGFRMAVLAYTSGHVSFVDGSVTAASFEPTRSAAAVTAPLADAGWAVRGFVKRGGKLFSTGHYTLEQDWVPYPAGQTPVGPGLTGWGMALHQREREQHTSLDAFGVLVLPAAEAELVPGGGDWTIEAMGDLVIVRHRDPDAWYASPRPDPDVLAAARRDLARLLPPSA
jgi:hypothetical protein